MVIVRKRKSYGGLFVYEYCNSEIILKLYADRIDQIPSYHCGMYISV